MKIEGTVFKKRIGKKSKTEYDAVCIKTADGSFVLRQPGHSPFKNPELEALAGKRIKAEGELVKDIFFMTSFSILSD